MIKVLLIISLATSLVACGGSSGSSSGKTSESGSTVVGMWTEADTLFESHVYINSEMELVSYYFSDEIDEAANCYRKFFWGTMSLSSGDRYQVNRFHLEDYDKIETLDVNGGQLSWTTTDFGTTEYSKSDLLAVNLDQMLCD